MHVEDAVRSRDDLDAVKDVLPLFERARHQTGGVGRCPSGDAVLDSEVVAFGHRFDSTTQRQPLGGVAASVRP
jgi:hypothetical protein